MSPNEQDPKANPKQASEKAAGFYANLAKKSYGPKKEDDQAILQHLPLVQHEVNRIRVALPPSVEVADLVSAGVVGLVQAFRRFDQSQGVAFSTFAVQRIRGAILDELRRADWMSRSVREKAKLVGLAIERIEQERGRPASDLEVAAELGLSPDEYLRLLDEIRPVALVELDAPPGMAEADSMHELVADPRARAADEEAHRRELIELMSQRIQEMPPAPRKVLAMYYYEGMKLAEIAQVFGVTESRICQIHAHAVLSLRTYLKRMLAK